MGRRLKQIARLKYKTGIVAPTKLPRYKVRKCMHVFNRITLLQSTAIETLFSLAESVPSIISSMSSVSK